MKTESTVKLNAPRKEFYQSVAAILRTARAKSYRVVNSVMIEAYWNVGRMIVEEEQQGKERADYGEFLIRNLSIRLTKEFGTGFSEQSLWNMRQYYNRFPILSALRRELTWTHYKMLIRVENEKARSYYLTEAAEQNWSTRALERQINSLYSDKGDRARQGAGWQRTANIIFNIFAIGLGSQCVLHPLVRGDRGDFKIPLYQEGRRGVSLRGAKRRSNLSFNPPNVKSCPQYALPLINVGAIHESPFASSFS